tara:strand:- start:46 stop:375 length:330 start_codon:yes stop_codon:yes gene_type:complete
MVDHRKFISRLETAALFNCHKATIERWESEGKLPVKSIMIGCICYYNRAEILKFRETKEKAKCGRVTGFKVTGYKRNDADLVLGKVSIDYFPGLSRLNININFNELNYL